jgi:hypothetical protein
LKENLANDDPNQQDRLVDEFRTLILGRLGMAEIQRDRAKERQMSEADLSEWAEWKMRDPDVPDGDWPHAVNNTPQLLEPSQAAWEAAAGRGPAPQFCPPSHVISCGLSASDAAVSAGRAEPTDCQSCYRFATNLLFARHADTGQ